MEAELKIGNQLVEESYISSVSIDPPKGVKVGYCYHTRAGIYFFFFFF